MTTTNSTAAGIGFAPGSRERGPLLGQRVGEELLGPRAPRQIVEPRFGVLPELLPELAASAGEGESLDARRLIGNGAKVPPFGRGIVM